MSCTSLCFAHIFMLVFLKLKACWNCGRKAHETCSGCNMARYCSSFCQHKDWENHHSVCGRAGPSSSSISSSTAAAAALAAGEQRERTTSSSGSGAAPENKGSSQHAHHHHQQHHIRENSNSPPSNTGNNGGGNSSGNVRNSSPLDDHSPGSTN